MDEIKGARLYVNLGASQTRRRLKGFGHGVRKVASAGRQRAVIIHTASGEHLKELRAKFADVGCSDCESGLSEPLASVRNLGPVSAQWLHDIGINTRAELEQLGAVAAYWTVRRRHASASLNLLWALAAGLQDRDWRMLSELEKQQLQAEFNELDMHGAGGM